MDVAQTQLRRRVVDHRDVGQGCRHTKLVRTTPISKVLSYFGNSFVFQNTCRGGFVRIGFWLKKHDEFVKVRHTVGRG